MRYFALILMAAAFLSCPMPALAARIEVFAGISHLSTGLQFDTRNQVASSKAPDSANFGIDYDKKLDFYPGVGIKFGAESLGHFAANATYVHFNKSGSRTDCDDPIFYSTSSHDTHANFSRYIAGVFATPEYKIERLTIFVGPWIYGPGISLGATGGFQLDIGHFRRRSFGIRAAAFSDRENGPIGTLDLVVGGP